MHPIGPFIDTKTFLRASIQQNIDRDYTLVDDDYNTTGILDWEWTYTDQKPWAFTSPMMLLHVNEFYNGKLEPKRSRGTLRSMFRGKWAL
ncbi:hypothetical protein BDV19DRAFT_390065 [Aspergillus venezuelensis]